MGFRNVSDPSGASFAAAAAPQRSARRSSVAFVLLAGGAGFCAYFSMYAFRKPFTAATYEQVADWGFALDYKIALVLAQVAGYALSKLIGIKLISELPSARRAAAIMGLVSLSWLALLAFAVVPVPYNVLALFVNGLPLGLIWGLVFGYLEGRRSSELLGAMLCASFILSSGVVKSVGVWLMTQGGVAEMWMPAATGALFFPLLAVSVWGLSRLPPPDLDDERERTRRAPMPRPQRAALFRAYAPGLVALVLAYVLFTAFRDFRDNFTAELWAALGSAGVASVFTTSELPVALLSLSALAAIMLVRDNVRATLLMHAIIAAGALLIGGATLALQLEWLGPMGWMVLSGAGLYIAYTPFNAMLFDRLIAASQRVGTAGFLIYVADASGYVASVALLLYRNFAAPELDWLGFAIRCAYATSLIGLLFVGAAAVYFRRKWRARAPAAGVLSAARDVAVPHAGRSRH